MGSGQKLLPASHTPGDEVPASSPEIVAPPAWGTSVMPTAA